jgi:hypothetical protein
VNRAIHPLNVQTVLNRGPQHAQFLGLRVVGWSTVSAPKARPSYRVQGSGIAAAVSRIRMAVWHSRPRLWESALKRAGFGVALVVIRHRGPKA